jgi:hypothetical protein
MRKLIAIASAALLVFVIAAPVEGTPATRILFDGFLHSCSGGGPDTFRVTPGGTVHIKGLTNNNRWATGNPLIDGVESNVVFTSFNFKTQTIRLDITLVPDAYPGSTWEIMQAAQFRPDGSLQADGVGHGTGALRGMTIKFTVRPDDPVAGVNLCNPDLNSIPLSGVIISH